MYYRIIRNDIVKSKLITAAILGFVTAAAMLVSLAAILAVNLSGAIDSLMIQAKTPHFLQMHFGEIDTARLKAFAEQNGNVDEYQVLEFLNVDGAQFRFNGKSLAGSVQDNGISIQSKQFDYLLDLDGNVINVDDGELYVPICYMRENTARVGDKAQIAGKEFTVAGFLRDSQMNSMLSSSKRFLVSENDYKELKSHGRTEFLIEFRLKDFSAIGAFETAYTSAGLEANGPTVTYPLFKTMNAISDGIMIAVILLVSALVVAIAFLCIRFTLLARIEEDYREIGVMKAIGLRVDDIRKIYLSKYAAIAAVGSILGFALSFFFKGPLLENIRLYAGEGKNASIALLYGITGILLVFLTIVAYVNGILKRSRRISAAEAVRFGSSQDRSKSLRHFSLAGNRLLDTNIFLGVKDVLSRKGIYATMLAVLVISAFIMIVPQNLYNTIASKGFIRYMGIGDCDLRADIQQADDFAGKAGEIAQALEADPAVEKYVILTTKSFAVKMDDGTEERIKVELGDHSVFPVEYSVGGAPVSEGDIALSVSNADALGKKAGDIITLVIGGKEKKLRVCGLYSDITNGGKTAKAVFADNSAEIMWCVLGAELSDKSLVGKSAAQYAKRFRFAKISGVDVYVSQMFGSTKSSVRKASIVSIAIALLLTVLVTLLFMKMLVAKDRYSIAVMKAFGFTNSDIAAQYVSRSAFVLVVGIVLGTLLSNTLGKGIAGAAISSFGASTFRFEINPVSAYLLSPLMMIFAVLIATLLGVSGIGRIRISENIKE